MHALMPKAKKSQQKKKTDSVLNLMNSLFSRVVRWFNTHGTEVNAVSALIVACATLLLAFFDIPLSERN